MRTRHHPNTLADRILGRRSSSEILANMQRIVSSAETAAERAHFEAIVAARDAEARARQERIWANQEQENV